MRAFAAYVLNGRSQATLVVVVTALLSLYLPILIYPGGAVLALVTLRLGWSDGLLLILLSLVVAGLLGWLVVGLPLIGLIFSLFLWLPIWAMAVSLKRTLRLARSILLASMFGLALVTIIHINVEDPAQWWFEFLQAQLQDSIEQLGGLEQTVFLQNLEAMSALMTGGVAAALSVSLISCLFLGRWWQALLYNPGGFGEEFRRLRIGRGVAVALGAVLLFSIGSVENGLLRDTLVVLLIPFVFQALAVAHTVVRTHRLNSGWLAALYVLLVVANAYMVLLLAFVGILDNLVNLRGRSVSASDGGDSGEER